MTNQSVDLDQLFHALADGTRRAVIERLSRGPASVSDLAGPLTLALPTLLQHLRVLEAGGLIRSEKAGRVRTCRLEPAALRLAEQWLGDRRTLWERRLDRLGAYLDDLPEPDTREPGDTP
ncbi:ArsR/SmtB family transcription factor [Ancylobacter terrae]|uniref:ArsR/SmtB family transcription factor n=1 Tax=Ancylobacter sp. sgz301288 TaxID=3342077 RepID=UPI003859E534